MAVDAALAKLQASAGSDKFEEALNLTSKLFRNIIDNPSEAKFRRLNPRNAKLESSLFCHAGAVELMKAAGFSSVDDFLELPQSVPPTFLAAHSAVQRALSARWQQKQNAEVSNASVMLARAFDDAVNGGAHGAGRKELQDIMAAEGGAEALQILEKILMTIRRYPDTKKYQSVNLAKASGKKVMIAMPLMHLAGFARRQEPAGEDWLEIARVNPDAIERIWAMVYWATQPPYILDLPISTARASRVFGAVLGAVVGDALGAPLAGKPEYSVVAQEIDKVLEMCGGGRWGMAPGQTTDCTELTICLADALAAAPRTNVSKDYFPLEDIALRYGRWGQTVPFHAEAACKQVFSGPLSSEAMMENAKDKNKRAVGAGALARCPLLAAFASTRGMDEATAADVARTDSRLSHPAFKICDASAVYVVLAMHLIDTCGDQPASLKALRGWVEREVAQGHGALDKPKATGAKGGAKGGKEDEYVAPGSSRVAFQEVMSWLNTAFGDTVLPFTEERLESSAKIAFMHAVRHVKLGSTFEMAMRATLAGGGDCSANAAIVGGLMGAMVGVEGIPPAWLRAVLTCDAVQGQRRPPEFHPSRLPELLQRMSGAS